MFRGLACDSGGFTQVQTPECSLARLISLPTTPLYPESGLAAQVWLVEG